MTHAMLFYFDALFINDAAANGRLFSLYKPDFFSMVISNCFIFASEWCEMLKKMWYSATDNVQTIYFHEYNFNV